METVTYRAADPDSKKPLAIVRGFFTARTQVRPLLEIR